MDNKENTQNTDPRNDSEMILSKKDDAESNDTFIVKRETLSEQKNTPDDFLNYENNKSPKVEAPLRNEMDSEKKSVSNSSGAPEIPRDIIFSNDQLTKNLRPRVQSNVKRKMDPGLKIFLWIFGSIASLVLLFIFSALAASYLKNNNFDIFSQFKSTETQDAATLDTVDKTDTEGTMTAEAIYKKIVPSIVGIVTYNPGQGLFSSGIGQGSGIIMKSDGYIITNAHVIGNNNKYSVTVVIDKKEYPAKVVGYDTRTDLAVLKIDAQDLTAAQFGNSDELNVGEWVLAIGNPGGLEFSNSLTRGIVSALNRSLSSQNSLVKYIQTDAAINPGNSGGALVNMYGQVVGINTAKRMDYEALGFAIPINMVKTIVDDIIKNGYVSDRVKIGITVRPISAYEAQAENVPQGVLIMEISKDSSLFQQNIQVGDIITKIDNVTVKSTSDLYGELAKHKPGDIVTLTLFRLSPITREGSTFDVNVTLIEDKG
ncbi:MAG: trypsin-like peptidase domain-containing protein [Clostridia bacterium]|nr:trypsin-like peptidase domain-containing protein [Clostridia bacterium]